MDYGRSSRTLPISQKRRRSIGLPGRLSVGGAGLGGDCLVEHGVGGAWLGAACSARVGLGSAPFAQRGWGLGSAPFAWLSSAWVGAWLGGGYLIALGAGVVRSGGGDRLVALRVGRVGLGVLLLRAAEGPAGSRDCSAALGYEESARRRVCQGETGSEGPDRLRAAPDDGDEQAGFAVGGQNDGVDVWWRLQLDRRRPCRRISTNSEWAIPTESRPSSNVAKIECRPAGHRGQGGGASEQRETTDGPQVAAGSLLHIP